MASRPEIRRPDLAAPAAAVRRFAAGLDRTALADMWRVFLWSRLLVFALGIWVWLRLMPQQQLARGPVTGDLQRLGHAFDGWPAQGVFRALFEPLTAWDSVQYLTIAHGGYGGSEALADPAAPPSVRAVFFPLFPLLTRVSTLFVHSTGAMIVGAFLVSLVAMLGALYLLHRLTTLELGRPAARPTLLLLAFFPSAFVLGAPYTESLFLLLSIGAIYAARTGHWAWAGVAAGLATATRNSGLILLIPLGVMYLWGPRGDVAAGAAKPSRGVRPRYPLRPNVMWLAIPPLVLIAFMVYLQQTVGDPFAWAHGQSAFHRESALPPVALWDGIRAAWDSLTGHNPVPYFDFGSLNVLNIIAWGAAVFALVGVFRRLPLAYGLYCVPLMILPLTAPWPDQPLASMLRYLLSVFPLFMWLGAVSAERKKTEYVLAVFAAVFGMLFVQFTSGGFTF
jgi:hypothetical protein